MRKGSLTEFTYFHSTLDLHTQPISSVQTKPTKCVVVNNDDVDRVENELVDDIYDDKFRDEEHGIEQKFTKTQDKEEVIFQVALE